MAEPARTPASGAAKFTQGDVARAVNAAQIRHVVAWLPSPPNRP
jgi:hypothetical protein